MNKWHSFKGWVVGWLAVLSFRLHLYRHWSNLYRSVCEKQYKGVQVPTFQTYEDLEDFLSTCRWSEDGLKRWLDTVSYPGKFKVTKTGDCEDFACFSASAINRSISYGIWKERESAPWAFMMAVTWQDVEGKIESHMVTLVNYADLTRTGNRYTWLDYHDPVTTYADDSGAYNIHQTPGTVARQIAHWYSGTESKVLAYGVFSTDLFPIAWKRTKG